MDPIISTKDLAALLGRSLSEVESTNHVLYLKIAQERLEDLLCTTLSRPLQPELTLLLARCFATIYEEQQATSSRGIKTKKVEDFWIYYDENAETPMEAFVKQNSAALSKYSKCQAEIRHGKVA